MWWCTIINSHQLSSRAWWYIYSTRLGSKTQIGATGCEMHSPRDRVGSIIVVTQLLYVGIICRAVVPKHTSAVLFVVSIAIGVDVGKLSMRRVVRSWVLRAMLVFISDWYVLMAGVCGFVGFARCIAFVGLWRKYVALLGVWHYFALMPET